jgi:hypothetical protein
MSTRTKLLAAVFVASTLAAPAFAQTAGGWTAAGDKVTLSAADGSSVIGFQCDASAGAMVVVANLDGGASQPSRITVRANNGTAYSVPVRPNSAGGLTGSVAMTLINQGASAPAATLIVTFPPSARPAIIVDVVPEFAAIMANCPRV